MLVGYDKGAPSRDEILGLAESLTSGDDFHEVEPYRRGLDTRAKGFFEVDSEGMFALSVSLFEHEPKNWFQASKIGKLLLRTRQLEANLVINDLEIPERSIQMVVYPRGVNVMEGEQGSSRTLRDPRAEDTERINLALLQVLKNHYGED